MITQDRSGLLNGLKWEGMCEDRGRDKCFHETPGSDGYLNDDSSCNNSPFACKLLNGSNNGADDLCTNPYYCKRTTSTGVYYGI